MWVTNIAKCDIPLKVTTGFIKIFGVNIGVKTKEARDATWSGILNKIKQSLKFWKMRQLRLRGKVIVVNSLSLFKFNYVIGAIALLD